MSSLRKNVAGQHIGFCLNSSAAGAAVTAGGAGNVVIDGGAQAACAGTFTHKGSGQWDYAPTQAETNGTSIGFAFTGTGAIQVGMTFFTIGYDPTQAQVPANVTQILGTASAGAAGSVSVDWAQTINKTSVVDFTQTTIKNLDGNTVQTGDAFARLGAPAGASVSGDVAAVKSDTGTILTDVNTGAGAIYTRLGAPAGASVSADIAAVNAKTTNLPASPSAVGSAMTLTAGERTSVADALLDRDMSVGADSGSTTVRTVRQALRFLRNKWAISTGTLTVFKEDDATSSWTAAVTTDGSALPIVSNDPAGP